MSDVRELTRKSFGYQWTVFGDMEPQFREDFLNYAGVPEAFFADKRGLDAGCGFGRHVWQAVDMGATMVGMDFSKAIVRAGEILAARSGVQLVQGDIERPPFRPGAFDFVYSFGVLHHMPDPERGFRALVPLVAPGGAIFVWVYSSSRRITNSLLECVRRLTARLPLAVTRGLALTGALVDWLGFVIPYRWARRLAGPRLERVVWPRIKLYARYPFRVLYADWFDRLAAPIRHYYGSEDLAAWASRAGLANVRISPTGDYGWRLYGEVAPRSDARQRVGEA